MALQWSSAKVLACLAAVLAGGAAAGSPGPALRGAESANGTAAGAPEIEAQPEVSVADPAVSELDGAAFAPSPPSLSRSRHETDVSALAEFEPDFEVRDDTTEEPYDGEEDMVDDEPDFDSGDDTIREPYNGEDGPVDGAVGSDFPFYLPQADVEKPITGCHGANARACPTGQSCVVRYGGNFSQCMDCSAWSWRVSCQKLDDYMRYSAIQTCNRTCVNAKCYNGAWCKKPYKCIVDKKSHGGQCIACKSRSFWKGYCAKLPKGTLRHAQHVCHKHCKGFR